MHNGQKLIFKIKFVYLPQNYKSIGYGTQKFEFYSL